MAKLYPPQIEGTIPAFCQSSSANETYITVPFAIYINSYILSRVFKLYIKETPEDGTVGDVESVGEVSDKTDEEQL